MLLKEMGYAFELGTGGEGSRRDIDEVNPVRKGWKLTPPSSRS